MLHNIPLSSKLDLIAQDGYALAASRQPNYAFHWHTHDCAMLLWPRAGALDSAWEANSGRLYGRLARGQALLLPAHVAHSTRSGSMAQQHGELYLSPGMLRNCAARGALQLDGAAQAMLDALWVPALSTRALPGLVHALIEQLAGSHPAGLMPQVSLQLARRWLDVLGQALDDGRPMPSVVDSAAVLGVSVRTLQRACLQEYEQTPVSLRRMLLARAARARLAAGEPYARVSEALGFVNSGHLGRLLKSVESAPR